MRHVDGSTSKEADLRIQGDDVLDSDTPGVEVGYAVDIKAVANTANRPC